MASQWLMNVCGTNFSEANYGYANGVSAFDAASMIARPKQKVTSIAVIIKMKPNHLPKAADTDGACARIAAIPFNFVRTVFIAESSTSSEAITDLPVGASHIPIFRNREETPVAAEQPTT
jgi:hypothetical protein